MKFKIMAERCNECLYGPDKIVSNCRRKELIKELNQKDDFFICHKATIEQQAVACRGDWDQRLCGQAGRIAGRLGILEFVSESELQQKEKESGKRKNQRGNKSE